MMRSDITSISKIELLKINVRGAHARLGAEQARHAIANEKNPEAWLTQVESIGHGAIEDERLLPLDAANESLLMGLRLVEGFDLERAEHLAGRAIDRETLDHLIAERLIETVSNRRIRVTDKGKPVLNAIVRALSF